MTRGGTFPQGPVRMRAGRLSGIPPGLGSLSVQTLELDPLLGHGRRRPAEGQGWAETGPLVSKRVGRPPFDLGWRIADPDMRADHGLARSSNAKCPEPNRGGSVTDRPDQPASQPGLFPIVQDRCHNVRAHALVLQLDHMA